MSRIARALGRALPLVADRRVLMLVALPLVIALGLWIFAGLLFGLPLTRALARAIAAGLAHFGFAADPGAFATAVGAIGAFVVLSVAAGVVALAAIAIFAAPVFVRVVEAHHFPTLAKKHGGTAAGSTINALVAVALWIPMALVALVFLLVPPIGIPLSLAASAWLNQRLFRYDALALHASRDEYVALTHAARGRLFGLGLALSPLSLVPFVNLVAPLYAGLAFTCLCLAELEAMRARMPETGRGMP